MMRSMSPMQLQVRRVLHHLPGLLLGPRRSLVDFTMDLLEDFRRPNPDSMDYQFMAALFTAFGLRPPDKCLLRLDFILDSMDYQFMAPRHMDYMVDDTTYQSSAATPSLSR